MNEPNAVNVSELPRTFQNAPTVEPEEAVAPVQWADGVRKTEAQLCAEFVGTFFFQIFGSTAATTGGGLNAAVGNGVALAFLVYATAFVSGGYLNPAVTFSQVLTGHVTCWDGIIHVIAQLSGAIVGSLMTAYMVPGASLSQGPAGPGCFGNSELGSFGQWFLWEFTMTWALVTVVYATAVVKPGHGSLAPLAIGFVQIGAAIAAASTSGGAINPARVLAPAIVFQCNWLAVPVYVFAQFLGGLAGSLLVIPLYGFGQFGPGFSKQLLNGVDRIRPKYRKRHNELHDTRHRHHRLNLHHRKRAADTTDLEAQHNAISNAAAVPGAPTH